jgi:hypothetical protein
MVQALQANELTLSDVEDRFNLRQIFDDPNFFREWQDSLPELNQSEMQALDRIRTEFLYLNKYPMLEDLVKMVILSPLLSIAGFYKPPLRPVLEKRVDVGDSGWRKHSVRSYRPLSPAAANLGCGHRV